MPVLNPNKVTFSAGAKVKVARYGSQNFTELGLLGEDANLVFDRQVRQKNDYYPEVPVAVAVRSESASLEFTVREWTPENVALAFGLTSDDVVTTTNPQQTTHTMKVGGRGTVNYYTLKIEEDLTNGERRVFTLHKAILGIRGGLPILTAETAADLPMVANAVYDPTANAVLTIELIEPVS